MITRRHLLATTATASAAMLAASRRRAHAADVDVVIIGAGAAGIMAGRELKALGRSFVILEARDRLGGRVFTDRSLGGASFGGHFDAGAAYIHFSDRNPWTALAPDVGLTAGPGSWRGRAHVYQAGKLLGEEALARRNAGSRALRDLVDERDVEDEDLSFAQAVAEANEDVKAAALQRTQMALGEEPAKASVAEWQSLWDGNNLVVTEGYGTLVERAGAGLPVRLSTPVTTVNWGGAGVVVETEKGSLSARAAIVTASVGVLKAGGIVFSPRLPAAMTRALDGLTMGALTKVALAIDPARWPADAPGSLSDLTDHSAMSVQIRPFEQPLLVAALGGDPARQLTAAGEAAACEHVAARLQAALGGEARKALGAGRLAGWWKDRYALGSYSLAVPGRLSARSELAKPVGDRLWFAGEASAGPASMTAGGAALSGQKAARDIAALLKA